MITAKQPKPQLVTVDNQALMDPPVLVERLLAAFQSPQYQPPVLPSIGMQLLDLSRRPDIDYRDVVALLEKDPILAGRVLRVSQSPVYASRVPIKTLKDAVVRLGVNAMTDIILMECMNMRVFRSATYERPMETIRRHGAATAHLARLLCAHVGLPDEYSFLCGLLHDVGMAGSLLLLADAPRGKTVPAFEKVMAAVRAAHEPAGQRLCELWKLAPLVSMAVGHHHDFVVDGKALALGAVVSLAESAAVGLGFGIDGDVTDGQGPRAQRALGMNDASMGQFLEDARQVTKHIQ